MVWMFPAAGAAKIVVIILMTWAYCLGDTTHIVVSSVEILYLVFNGARTGAISSGLHYLRWRGTSAAALYLRVNESCTDSQRRSNKRKSRSTPKAERAENIKKMIKPSINGEGLSNRAAAMPRSISGYTHAALSSLVKWI